MGPLARLLQGDSHEAARAQKVFPPGRRITSKATPKGCRRFKESDRAGTTPSNLPAVRVRRGNGAGVYFLDPSAYGRYRLRLPNTILTGQSASCLESRRHATETESDSARLQRTEVMR